MLVRAMHCRRPKRKGASSVQLRLGVFIATILQLLDLAGIEQEVEQQLLLDQCAARITSSKAPLFQKGSSCIPGSYPTNNWTSEDKRVFPRSLALCTNSKKSGYNGNFS
jgi:hypothetical protein